VAEWRHLWTALFYHHLYIAITALFLNRAGPAWTRFLIRKRNSIIRVSPLYFPHCWPGNTGFCTAFWAGLSIGTRPLIVRTILLTWNWLPLVIYLVLLARIVDHYARTDWGAIFAVGTACFGTFITTFSTTLNNHTVAAVA
jgi:hypothetical protein